MDNRFGLIAADGERHLAELVPDNKYLNSPETVTDWEFKLTTVDWRKKELSERLEKSEKLFIAGEIEEDILKLIVPHVEPLWSLSSVVWYFLKG